MSILADLRAMEKKLSDYGRTPSEHPALTKLWLSMSALEGKKVFTLADRNYPSWPFRAPVICKVDSDRYAELKVKRAMILEDMDRKVEVYRESLIQARLPELQHVDMQLQEITQHGLSVWMKETDEVAKMIDGLRALWSDAESKMQKRTSGILSSIGYVGAVIIGRAQVMGVYFLYSDDIDLLYIGQSKNINRRVTPVHPHYSGDEGVTCVEINDETERKSIERAAIAFADPMMNKAKSQWNGRQLRMTAPN